MGIEQIDRTDQRLLRGHDMRSKCHIANLARRSADDLHILHRLPSDLFRRQNNVARSLRTGIQHSESVLFTNIGRVQPCIQRRDTGVRVVADVDTINREHAYTTDKGWHSICRR